MRTLLIQAVVVTLLAVPRPWPIAAPTASAAELARYEASHRAMGSLFTIVLYAESDEAARAGFTAAFRRIVELDKILSDYDPKSELSRLSAAAPTSSPVNVSDDLWRVLSEANRVSRASDGAFDVTVGPLTTLWRNARKTKAMPPEVELRRALSAVGYRHVQLDEKNQSVSLKRPNMRLDLGGIAKGYAVDEALAVLRKHGITQALVNGGGDIALGDAPPSRTGWKIGVAPLEAGAEPSMFLALKSCAVATSGDAWQFVEIDGRRYSHIVDPKTGLGLADRASVTIIAPNCTTADAWASAVSVLGVNDGLTHAEAIEGVEALIVYEKDERTSTARTAGFDKLPRAGD